MNNSIYTCNNCKKDIKISDRFCYNCGIYLGEPAGKDENGINRLSQDTITYGNENDETSKASFPNEATRSFISLSKPISGMIINPLYNIQTVPLKLGYLQTIALTLFYMVSHAILYVTFSRFVFDSPQRLIYKFFNISSSYNPTTYMGLSINAIAISIVLIIILFSSIYLISSLAFNSYGELMSLWNVIILSQIPNLLGLAALQLLWKFNEILATASVILFFTTSTLAIFKGAVNTLNGDESKTAYTVACSYIFSYLGFVGYLKAFMG